MAVGLADMIPESTRQQAVAVRWQRALGEKRPDGLITGLPTPKNTFVTPLPYAINTFFLSGLDHEQDLNNKRFAVDCKSHRNPYAFLSRFSRLVSLAGSF
jgi:hypothetical protein